jgi:pilus assembly protein TadC
MARAAHQSDQMRIKRRQYAEEQAHKAPIKMLIPMALLIFPTICIVLMTGFPQDDEFDPGWCSVWRLVERRVGDANLAPAGVGQPG